MHYLCVTSPSTGKWSSPPTTGPGPSPCAHVSFTAINNHQAVLFGGRQPHDKVNDCYLMDFESMVRPESISLKCISIHSVGETEMSKCRGGSRGGAWGAHRRIELCVKLHEKPRVTHGMVLRETYLELLMGSFYVSTATTYSWCGFT